MFDVNHIRKIAPDVILLDIDLMEDWGVAIFEILRKSRSTKSIPIILIASQLTPEELKGIADQLGAEDFVSHLSAKSKKSRPNSHISFPVLL